MRNKPTRDAGLVSAIWQSAPELQGHERYLTELKAHEIYHPQPNSERDNTAEFCDALNHVKGKLFDALPDRQKARHLLEKDDLNEKEIKQLHNI